MQTAELIHYEPLSGVLEKEMSGLLTVAKGRVFASGEETSFIMDVSEAAFPNPSMNPLKSSIVYFVARRGNCLSATACVNLTSSSFCTLCSSLFRKQVNVCTSYHSTLCGMTHVCKPSLQAFLLPFLPLLPLPHRLLPPLHTNSTSRTNRTSSTTCYA